MNISLCIITYEMNVEPRSVALFYGLGPSFVVRLCDFPVQATLLSLHCRYVSHDLISEVPPSPPRPRSQDMLPYNDYFEYYGPDYRLHMPTSNMENMNKRETLEEVR